MKNDDMLELSLKRMAEEHRPQLPSAGLLWWRAQLVRRQQDQERIERPMRVMRQLATIFAVALLVALVAENSAQLKNVMRDNSWFLMPALVLTTAAVLFLTMFSRWPGRSRAKQVR